jgi:octaheme c-type cytochrome (tetrathionate reductase family)
MNKFNLSILVKSCCLLLPFFMVMAGFATAGPPLQVERNDSWVAPRQEAAKKWAAKIIDLIVNVDKETASERRLRLLGKEPKYQDIKSRYFFMESPFFKNDPDMYEGVRFMHAKHAQIIGECFTCHHHRPADPEAKETVRCSGCHQKQFDARVPGRPGLKGAYHRLCSGCHKKQEKGPVHCKGCHETKVPNHEKWVNIEEDPDPEQVTESCLKCHDTQAEDFLTTAHWLWKGPTPYIENHEKNIQSGKATDAVNNFCIHIASNWRQCTSCHAGYGWVDDSFDFTEKANIDCLVCHDTTDTYLKGQSLGGFPDEDVDLIHVAKKVGKTSRFTCGDCHFAGGGGDSVKHGDMSSVLYYPDPDTDVHMGGYDYQCAECHPSRNHRIAGRSFLSPVAEGGLTCESCHTSKPHQSAGLLNHHLNTHGRAVACTTCHLPVYNVHAPSKTFWDWSKTGDKGRKKNKNQYGKNDYSLAKGEFKWNKGVKPAYSWYNGKAIRYLMGDKINPDPDGETFISKPVGDILDPSAQIFPYKIMEGIQGADAKYNYLLAGHVYGPGGYSLTLDWQKSFREGMEAIGLDYSGEYKWVKTTMYISLNHEIPPKEIALSCVQCHSAFKSEKTCDRCHQDKRNIDYNKLANKNIDAKRLYYRERKLLKLVESTDYLNVKELGYKGDPIEFGGRFKKLPLGYKAK